MIITASFLRVEGMLVAIGAYKSKKINYYQNKLLKTESDRETDSDAKKIVTTVILSFVKRDFKNLSTLYTHLSLSLSLSIYIYIYIYIYIAVASV